MPKKTLRKPNEGFWQKGKLDWVFLVFVFVLVTVGIIMMFSASYAFSLSKTNDSYTYVKSQAKFAAIGIGLMLFISKINVHFIRKFTWVIYLVTFILLVIVLFIPPSKEGLQVRRWIPVFGFSFQPSEIAKFAIILVFSNVISNNYKRMKDIKFILVLVALLSLICGLVAVETHVSATILIAAIGVMLLIMGGMKLRYVFITGGVGVAAFIGLIAFVGYGANRIKYWLDPWSDPTDNGFQVIQSLLAIGSGGIMGRGIGQSRQKYLYVPEPQNDFIFSIICEEIGWIGAMAIVAVFAILICTGLKIALSAPDRFSSLMVAGIMFQVGIQTFLNIGVVTKLFPNTGISLPFFSYGGTALIVLLVEMGVVLSISRSANLEKT